MAKVRCPCGRQYAIADEHVGQRVKCRACGRSFLAAAPGAPPTAKPRAEPAPKPPEPRAAAPAPRPRIGELAVARGFISERQLASCLQYQQTLHRKPRADDRLLGQILLERQLINQAQLERLLEDQPEAPVREAPPPKAARRRRAAHPVAAERRESLRRSVEAAARRRAQVEETRRESPLLAPLDRLRMSHFVIALAVLGAALVVWRLWPPPQAKRTLVEFLQSCSEDAIAPNRELALREFNLDVRSFDDVTLRSARAYDYAAELQAFVAHKDAQTWADLLAKVETPKDKHQALALAIPAFPKELAPRATTDLRVTVQPAILTLQWKPRGTGIFRESRCEFFMVEVKTPTWTSGWKVGGYRDIGGGTE